MYYRYILLLLMTANRSPSPYNVFMKRIIMEVQVNDPTLDHKEAFIKAAII